MRMYGFIGDKGKQKRLFVFAFFSLFLVLLSFLLPAIAYASSPSSGSGFQFGTSQALDQAGVSVVRLVVTYTLSSAPTPPTGGGLPAPGPQCTGLGVIIRSWTALGTSDQNTWVLTDSALVDPNRPACVSTSGTTGSKTSQQLTSIAVFASTAYTNNATQPILLGTYTSVTGGKLIPQGASTSLEQGMPWLTTQGQLAGMNIKGNTGNTRITSSEIMTVLSSHPELKDPQPPQLPHANPVHDAWNKAVSDYYAKNYRAVQADLVPIGPVNAQFAAATGLSQQASAQVAGPKPTPHPNTGTSAPASTPIPFWEIAVTGLILLIAIIVVVISILFMRRHAARRHTVAQFEEEQKAAEEQADLNARKVAEEEAKRKQAQKVQQKSAQQHNPSVQHDQPVPAKNTINITPVPQTTLFCPNCKSDIPAGATFCGNCGFQTTPVQGETYINSSPVLAVESPVPVPVRDTPIISLVSAQPSSNIEPEYIQNNEIEDEKIPNRVGQKLGNYTLIKLLGEGGFAEVYLGEHIHIGSYAAIKVLHSQLSNRDREYFRREAQTIVHLIHPHIIRVLDFGIDGKTPYLVMDFAPNGTLRQKYRKGARLSLPTIISYVTQISDALQFAHNQKLIHRDIKPENMLIAQNNNILLSDFGIAIVQQSSRYQGIQNMAGTIAYMAPEQVQSHPRIASDQYALGIVVYEWLCGKRPFYGAFAEVASKHMLMPPPSLREQVPMISNDVEKVVMTALAKDPKDRFPSVRAFAVALEEAYNRG